VSAELTFSGLTASDVSSSDIDAIRIGIASVISGVAASDIDNVAVTDASRRRRLKSTSTTPPPHTFKEIVQESASSSSWSMASWFRTLTLAFGRAAPAAISTSVHGRRLTDSAKVSFDVSVSLSTSVFTSLSELDDEVSTALSAEVGSSDDTLVNAIQDAADSGSSTFDSLDTVTALTVETVTRPPTAVPSPVPTTPAPSVSFNPTFEPTFSPTGTWDNRETYHYYILGGSTLLVIVISVFVYYTHPGKSHIAPTDVMVAVFAWADFVGDACWIDILNHRGNYFFCYTALFFLVLPTVLQVYYVSKLIHKGSKKRWLDTHKLTSYSTITIILITFTDPDAVILLPWNPTSYELENSPYPNKQSLFVTGWKVLEDVPELCLQVAYIAYGRQNEVNLTYTYTNMTFTAVMMAYDFAAKLLQYACTPDPEKPSFNSTEHYDWTTVEESDELGKFLEEATIHKGAAKLERLLRRDGFETIGDFADLTTNHVQVYIDKKIPHLNVKKLVEYIEEVFETHQQPTIQDLKVPPAPESSRGIARALSNLPGASSMLEAEVISGSLPTLNESRPAGDSARAGIGDGGSGEAAPAPASRPQTTQTGRNLMRKQDRAASSLKREEELLEALRPEAMHGVFDALKKYGIKRPHQLLDLEQDDEEALGITHFQLKVLHKIGRKYVGKTDLKGNVAVAETPAVTSDHKTVEMAVNNPPSRDIAPTTLEHEQI